ncbi:hypothetical protein [Dyella mobilis]|uniref:Uncharacterized protein n=1 Tax=Dyella mobilis TaxID=1849582 RepID=A0ABS2KFE3_9GAMM|nr:hypothetical protein [Dyella mobilis]MBM7129679.1 hypothetical protein [Dyella mobilis]GLQ98055.1 hypothetical protein GCM10007863_24750 [Dyella mobilis]
MSSGFYDAGALRQVAINLFHGWGYNFYRKENQLRADDLLVRSKTAWLLGRAREGVEAAESSYRRTELPPPTRQHPFPSPQAVAGAQSLERLAQAIGTLKGRIEALPAPENDRMTQRYRTEAATLETLIAHDEQLIGQADLLRSMVEGADGTALIAAIAEVESGLAAIQATLHEREAVLLNPIG